MSLFQYARYTLIFLLIFNSHCSKKIAEDINKSLGHSFLYNDDSSKKNLKKLTNQTEIVDSLFKSIVEKNRGGSSFKELHDLNKVNFTLGYTTPKTYSNNQSYPLIIYLHGGIGTTRSDKGKEAWNMFQFIQDSIDIFIASPSANRETPWWTEAGLNRIILSLKYMTLNYPIDPDRIFLAGVSDGGTACYAVANQTNSLFAGFFAISGLGAVLQNFGIKLYPQNLMQENIYNINADNDRLYPVENVNQFISSLRSQGVYIENKIYKGEQHGFDYKMKEMNKLLTLLKSWRRKNNLTINHIIDSECNLISPIISNIERETSKESYINFHFTNDTLNLRSDNIKFFTLRLSPDNKDYLYIKKGKNIKKVKKSKPKKITDFFINTFHPKEYNKEIYHITLE